MEFELVFLKKPLPSDAAGGRSWDRFPRAGGRPVDRGGDRLWPYRLIRFPNLAEQVKDSFPRSAQMCGKFSTRSLGRTKKLAA
jgi:hypothetical protein